MYTGLDLNAIHLASNCEKFNISNMNNIAFRIPCIMPLISGGLPKDVSTKLIKSNITNRVKTDIVTSSNIVTCNYIRLNIPQHLIPDIPHDIVGNVEIGLNFLVVFIEGNHHNIRIIGRA